MTMRRTVYLALLAGVMIGLAASLAAGSSRQVAVANGGCSNHSLRGPYGFAGEGQIFTPPGGSETADFASAGQVTFDGQGGLTGSEWESFNGVISPTTPAISFSGTYAVESDCTGSATIAGLKARLMLVERGQEVNIFATDFGVVAAGQITKQEIGQCSNATLHGVYSFAATGSQFGASGEAADFAVFARVVLDGRGNSTESANISVNGLQFQDTQQGTYTVQANCTGSASSKHLSGPFAGQTDHVNFVVVEGGKEIKFIAVNPGFVFSGSVDKQPMDAD
jgi:hypothetical protein